MSNWYTSEGPEQDVVVSSRIRLARNFTELPFPTVADTRSLEDAITKVQNGIKDDEALKLIRMNTIPQIDREYLVETHMISPEFAGKTKPCAIVVKGDNLGVMVNEEDHLRIQCIEPGLQFENAFEICKEFEQIPSLKDSYAFNQRFGFLTSCPTNTGTGIRASAMVHLPAMAISEQLSKVFEACGKLGIAVRGIYGENSRGSGNLYQISNQVTLGQSDIEIIEGIKNIILQIAELERATRDNLKSRLGLGYEDRLYKSFGILSQARLLSSEEAMQFLSDLKLAVDSKIINNINSNEVINLMISVQPASIQKLQGEILSQEERDSRRASIIRGRLKSVI
ncbi:MAG: protein arginine kinase [Clostridiales bacterium]|jgi:protein arginine kinase|nr:protein arginine kinase [Clostridiales bacterium]